MERAGLVFVIPSDYPILEKSAEIEAILVRASDFHIAALRLAAADLGREALIGRAKALKTLGAKREIAVLLDDRPSLAGEMSLDGVHLSHADAKSLREARRILGKDAVIGVHAGASRHEGMVLGEIGVDYVSFGPLQDRGLDEAVADVELFAWWAEMIELPLIAEGAVDAPQLEAVGAFVDFVALGDEVFKADDPIAALDKRLEVLQSLGG